MPGTATQVLSGVRDGRELYWHLSKPITANLPEDLLEKAMQVTGKGITETMIEGLQRLQRARAYEKAMALKGRIHLDIDLDESRERSRS